MGSRSLIAGDFSILPQNISVNALSAIKLALLCLASASLLAAAPLQWSPQPAGSNAPVQPFGTGAPGFTLLSNEASGIRFTNFVSEADATRNHNYLNGGGVSLGDVDADGLCDIFFCNISGRTALFKNLGDWKFTDVSQAAGLALDRSFSHGATFADVDGDRDLDLIVTFTGPGARLFLNDGKGKFTDANATALAARAGSTSIALADVDADGDLDLYISNYGENTIRSGATVTTTFQNGQEVVMGRLRNRLKIIQGKLVEYGEPDAFYLNDGRGGFTKVDRLGGSFLDEHGSPLKAEQWDMGLSVMFRDINQDGHPDIYVCNDFQDPDRIWINNGQGKFQAIARGALRTTSHFSMGVDFADIDHDGHDDFFTLDMLSRFHSLRMTQMHPKTPTPDFTGEPTFDRPQYRRNMLHRNRGDGTYEEIGQYAGVDAADWAWCPVFLDVDLDGFEDLLVANGHLYDTQDLDAMQRNEELKARTGRRGSLSLHEFPTLLTPNNAFRNAGNYRFEEVGAKWGFNSPQVSHTIALGDLDNDGDSDLVVSSLNSPPLLYRNNSSAPRVGVRLRGLSGNTYGIGARITLEGGAVAVQSQEIMAGGRFIGSDEPFRSFAAGEGKQMSLRVRWRSGLESVLTNITANRTYIVDEASARKPAPSLQPPKPKPLFADASTNLNHRHRELPLNDFEREPLLPHQLSVLGPGVAWGNLNNDGDDDLLVSGGDQQPPIIFQSENGRFIRQQLPAVGAEQLASLILQRQDKGLTAISGSGLGKTNFPSLAEVRLNTAQPLANITGPAGSLAAADVNGDGALDLFVGGRALPGAYPQGSPNRLFLGKGDSFEPDPKHNEALAAAGLANGATFTDVNNDGWPDLALACEWGPLRIFLNEKGLLVERTEQFGLSGFTGLWNGVTTADFDGDGALDLAASNWGENTAPRPEKNRPLTLYVGDFDQSGSPDLLLAYLPADENREMPWHQRSVLETGLPLLTEKFPAHKAYSKATVADIIGSAKHTKRSVTHFSSMILLNRGNRYEARTLPPAAQFSPAFGLVAGDFDGDGNEDLFFAQNFSGVRPEAFKMDAGRGLLLVGNGDGDFEPMNAAESGIAIHGDQRGAAASDYDQDGRLDLVVAQNNDSLVLLHNQSAPAGVRVTAPVGAAVRPVYRNGKKGPLKLITSGTGYFSQNSQTLIFGNAAQISSIEVRWPGGKASVKEVQGQQEIKLTAAE